jgi:outer membrane protein assembly factor BamB
MYARLTGFLLLSIGLVLGSLIAFGSDWPQFRGPGGSGVSDEKELPSEWSAEQNVKWKVEIPGVGWSSPIVWGDRVFITTAVSDKQAKPKPGGGFGGGKGGPGGGMGKGGGAPNQLYQFEILCLDRDTGKTLWKQTALEAKPRISTHTSNTFATETPATDGRFVFAYFGMNGLFCYDFNGKQIWKKDLGKFSMQNGWGSASSPVLDGDRLFIQCDNEEKSFLIALDKTNGEELWRISRNERSTWGTPIIWKNKKRTELVAVGNTVCSYDSASRKLLWELHLGGGQCSVSPVADEEMLYVGAGAGGGGGGGGGVLFAVKAGAEGDITPKRGESKSEGVAWSQTKAGLGMSSPLVYKGYVYVLERNGGLVNCFDAKTGKPAYAKERVTGARSFWASPWANNDKIFCPDEEGNTFVLKAGPEFDLIGKNSIREMVWSSPAAASESVFVRGVDHLYCIKREK